MTLPLSLPNRAVRLTNLVPHPRNYRSHPPDQILNLKESLKRFGQVRSIVVQERPSGPDFIVAGHGIVQAANDLGWAFLRADILPSDWTDAQIEGYLIADNLHVLGAEDDLEQLSSLLKQQSDSWSLSSLGSSEDELSAIMASLNAESENGYADDDDEEDDERDALRVNADRADEDEDRLSGDDDDDEINPLVPQLPTVLAGMGIKDIGTTGQRLDAYNNSLIRQIMLVLDQEQYMWAVEALKRLMRARQIKNHTELVLALLREAVDALPPLDTETEEDPMELPTPATDEDALTVATDTTATTTETDATGAPDTTDLAEDAEAPVTTLTIADEETATEE